MLADRILNRIAFMRGYQLTPRIPPDMDDAFRSHHQVCSPFTMTSAERLWALSQAVRHVTVTAVPGDFVECGVWRGGSTMLAASTLLDLGESHRELWLYDTFAGMSEPSEVDGGAAHDTWASGQQAHHNEYAFSPLDEVRAVMSRSSYPPDLFSFVKGKVEETIPATVPDAIALLRIDTDWYESTLHELTHLWPRLSSGGVLIIDDYGHMAGAKKAVDEFFASRPVLLHRIDYTGRTVQKP